jgi:hypothetical protein
MTSLHGLAVWSAALLFPLAAYTRHIPTPLEYSHFTRRQFNISQAQHELGSQLSSVATIFGPTDADWANATERYDTYAPPKIQLVVIPGTESDVPIIVSCSVEHPKFITALTCIALFPRSNGPTETACHSSSRTVDIR